ncbi:hypothetical protein GCM10020220_051450 [Nonomuraea rubra]
MLSSQSVSVPLVPLALPDEVGHALHRLVVIDELILDERSAALPSCFEDMPLSARTGTYPSGAEPGGGPIPSQPV